MKHALQTDGSSRLKQGVVPIWLMGGVTGVCCLAVLAMSLLLLVKSAVHFWPSDLLVFEMVVDPQDDPVIVAGQLREVEQVSAAQLRAAGEEIPDDLQQVERWVVKVGNRELNGLDFLPVSTTAIVSRVGEDTVQYPPQMAVLERKSWGNFYGYATALHLDGEPVAEGEQAWSALLEVLPAVQELLAEARALEYGEIRTVARKLDRQRRRSQGSGEGSGEDSGEGDGQELRQIYQGLEDRLRQLQDEAGRYVLTMETADGAEADIRLADIVRAYRPNEMGLLGKLGVLFARLWEFLSDEPREANTEGGVFPAIFGTVSMVMLMALLVTPFGVAAAFYLREYRRQGPVVRIIRISINNLAGVPSIVFGIFGLGFFVYGLGGSLDEIFFADNLPSPTFGTPGLFWASLTMALLTLPVVVVATEEGLTRVPNSMRHGALALGATRFEMLFGTVLPMAVPGILTGLILAVARAAGEVAPLVLVGAVKFAPTLPLDAEFPFLHLERKFMHLGYHIYDAGFQSPNAEAAQPLVYATALLLVTIILLLNLTAMLLRNKYRERFISLEI